MQDVLLSPQKRKIRLIRVSNKLKENNKMKRTKTITGREIVVTPLHEERAFLIEVDGRKYKTIELTPIEFESSLNDTANDWQTFLRQTNDYYLINQ